MLNINSTSPSLISIWAILLPSALYFLHWYVVKNSNKNLKTQVKIFSEAGMKYVWNVILLLLFIPSGVFGLLLGLGIKTPFLVYWHYQAGAAFVIVALIHMLNHLAYYLQGWKVFKK